MACRSGSRSPVGSDAKLLGLGMSIEAILGTAPRPKA
jgi:hypothetical protein